MNTVAICDTEPIAIEGLCSLLRAVDGFDVVTSGTSMLDMVEEVRASHPAVTVIDKSFGVAAVLDGIRALRRVDPPTATVVWGASISEAEALQFLQAGAAGVVRKSAPLPVLMECFEAVLAGRTWMEAQMLADPERAARPFHKVLTAREVEVMALVERGMKNRDIATTLGICTGTVKIHLKHIFEKTGIHGRYGLALSGLRDRGRMSADAAEETV